jgi:hypothetical protein
VLNFLKFLIWISQKKYGVQDVKINLIKHIVVLRRINMKEMNNRDRERNALLKRVKKANLERLRELKLKKKNKLLRGLEFEELTSLQTKYNK